MTAELYAFRRNVVLVASAGTGKTHALVGVLVHALLGVSDLSQGALDPARIAATTFSRKAAAEIRARLTTELERLAFGGASPYEDALAGAAKRLDVPWGPAVCAERARAALARAERATIGTLHGLAYSIARTHAFALGLPPSFAVASEDDTDAWASAAIEAALVERAARDADGVRDLFRVMRGTERAQSELVRILLALEEDGREATTLAAPEGDADVLASRVVTLVEQARALRDDARCATEARALVDAYAARDVPSLVRATSELFAVRRPRGEDGWLPIRDELPGGTLRERAETLVRAWAARERVVPAATLVRDVLARAQTLLAEAHARAGAVGFGAALRLARDALRDDPSAAARASSAYDALLVDEFQDTSRVQVELLRLLWQRDPRSRAPGAMPVFGDLRPRGLLVVGDRKQSIYAFRGADVGVFVATCIELAGERAASALEVPAGSSPMPARTTADFFVLRESYRATAPLIDFVNAFSAECLVARDDDPSEARYAPVVESLVPSATTTRPPGPAALWLRPPGEARDTSRLEDATLATTYIAEALDHGCTDDGLPLRFRDFAVLAQSNEMLDAAAFALSRAGIPHVVAGRGFFAAREVQDVLAIARYLDRPSDRAALLSILRGPFAALSDRTLVGLTELHRGLVTDLERWDSLDRRGLVDDDDRPALERVRAALRSLRRASERLGPGRTLREAVRELEIEQTLLLQPRGAQRIANVRKLLLLADEERSVRSLLDRVARAEVRAREPEAATFSEDDDAVRLLTIHASKGLAFRIVVVPELRATPVRGASTTLGVDLRASRAWLAIKVLGDLGEPVTTPSIERLTERERALFRADRRRLLYVAVTRARERVVFVGNAKKSGRAEPGLGPVLETLAASRSPTLEVREAPFEPPRAPARAETEHVEIEPPRAPRTLAIAIAPTALQDFHHCSRRFELVHVVALPEPTPSALGRFRRDGVAQPSAREEGEALHRVLEHVDLAALGADDARDRARATLVATGSDLGLDDAARERVVRAAGRFLASEYARRIRDEGGEVFRERAFVLELTSPDLRVTLRGAMDLVVVWPGGDVDVVDYKRARGPDVRPHALQLDVYALAARDLGGGRARAGAVFLGGDAAPEPTFRPPQAPRRLEAHLLALGASLLEARRDDRFPRAAPKTCHAIGCGYFNLCHPAKEKRQLSLFR